MRTAVNFPSAVTKALLKICLNLFVLTFFFLPLKSLSQTNQCDEVPVTLIVDYFGHTELPSVLCGNEAYFSVPGLFEFLHVKIEYSPGFQEVSGFLEDQDDIFLIDEPARQITYKNKVFSIAPTDIIRTRTNLFLKAEYFSKIFGLQNEFSSRNLAATLVPKFELPAVKAAKREQLRENIRRVNGKLTADTTILRERPLLHFGAASWNINTVQQTDGIYYNRFGFGLGGLLAGGELTGNINYNSGMEFTTRNLFYQWRHVNNEKELFRQFTLGKIASRSVSSIYHPVVGAQVTNAPTFVKRSFGTYTLSDHTKPDWIVELYINNILVDYTQADASGFFSFDVPLTYGTTQVNLRYYGPWGEEEISTRNFNIPYQFLSPGEFHYTLSSGMVEDGKNSKFFQGRTTYGLTEHITIGGGLEYLSSLEKNPLIPFLNTSVRLPENILLSGEYMHHVGYKGNLSYTAPSSLRLALSYKKFEEEQEAVRFSYLEERQASLTFPLQFDKFIGTSRFNFQQNVLQNNTYTHLEWSLSGSAWGLRANLTNTAFINQYSDPLVYSRLSTAIRLPENFVFSPKLEYEHLRDGLTSFEAELRKRFFKMLNFQASYTRNFRFDQYYINVGLSFDLGFTRVGMNSSTNKRYTSFSQSAGGSIMFEPTDGSWKFDHRPMMGRGSIKFEPFLDRNGNGVRDQNESGVDGVTVHLDGGGMREQQPDGITIFKGLEPYISYYFTLDTRNLKNIAWQVDHESMEIFFNPNQMKVMEIPVKVVGEVAGFVNFGDEGIGGISVIIFDAEGNRVNDVLTASDGYFSYLGLPSGEYIARVDQGQLENLNLEVNGDFPFTIHNTREGDYMDNLEFFLAEAEGDLEGDASEGQEIAENASEEDNISEAAGNTSVLTEANEIEEPASEETDGNLISEAAENTSALAEANGIEEPSSEEKRQTEKEGLVYKVQFLTSKNAIFEGDPEFKGLRHVVSEKSAAGYRYVWGKTRLPREAAALQNELRRTGLADAYVVHYYNGQRISVEEAVTIRKGEILSSYNVSEEKQERTEDGQPKAFKKHEGLRFRVQIAASKVPLDTTDDRLNGIHGVEEYRHDKMYKYSLGNFSSFGEANQYKNVLRSQGLTDAFVVPFHNDRRLEPQQKRGMVFFKDSNLKGIGGISLSVNDVDGNLVSKLLSEADGSFVTPNLHPGTYSISLNDVEIKGIGMKSENKRVSFTISEEGSEKERLEFILTVREETLIRSKAKDEGLVFKVQVLASILKLPVDHSLLRGLEHVSRYRHKGLYKYTVGESNNLETIRKLQKEVRKRGFEDAFIVPFLNDVRINLQEMAGHIFVMSGDEKQGIGGMNIEIYQKNNHITSLTSNRDGKVSFLGLKPGVYTARIEEGQLQELQMKLKRSSNEFEIQRNYEGVIKQPVLFELERIENRDLQKESSKNDEIEYRIQLAASNVPLEPNHPTLEGIKDISMYRHNGMFKYTLGSTHSLSEARKLMEKIRETHKFSLFIVGFKDGKRILVIE